MRINMTSTSVSDQEQALIYYTEVLGLRKKSAHTANVTRSTITKLNDTCGNLIQISQLARY